MSELPSLGSSWQGKLPLASRFRLKEEVEASVTEGHLLCWSYDDEEPGGTGPWVPNRVYYAPHDWPVAGNLLTPPRVVRFISLFFYYNFIDWMTRFGPDPHYGYDPFREPMLNYLFTLPASVRADIAGSGVLVAGHEGVSGRLNTSNASGGHNMQFLRFVAPPVSVSEAGFFGADVLNIVVLFQNNYYIPFNYDTGTLIRDYPRYYSFPSSGETPYASWLTPSVLDPALYDNDRARVVAAYPRFPRSRTVLYHSHHAYGFVRGWDDAVGGPFGGKTFDATSEDWADVGQEHLQAVAADLSAYGVEYGGRVTGTEPASTFLPLIRSHFGLG
jgi:hypothetical protein